MFSPRSFPPVPQVIQEGSPEIRVLECVPQGSDGISKADLEAALGADLVKVRMVWYGLAWYAVCPGASLAHACCGDAPALCTDSHTRYQRRAA